MDFLKKNRLFVIIIAVLVVLNLVTISFMVLSPKPTERKSRAEVVAFVERELGLTDAQKKIFSDLREKHMQKMTAIAREQHELRRSMFDLLKQESPDQDEVRRKADAIGQKETEVALETFDHFRQLRTSCTPEQQIKLDSIIREVLRTIRPPRPESDHPPLPDDTSGVK
jgi:Spy/CpxP family protein refolding chaperone